MSSGRQRGDSGTGRRGQSSGSAPRSGHRSAQGPVRGSGATDQGHGENSRDLARRQRDDIVTILQGESRSSPAPASGSNARDQGSGNKGRGGHASADRQPDPVGTILRREDSDIRSPSTQQHINQEVEDNFDWASTRVPAEDSGVLGRKTFDRMVERTTTTTGKMSQHSVVIERLRNGSKPIGLITKFPMDTRLPSSNFGEPCKRIQQQISDLQTSSGPELTPKLMDAAQIYGATRFARIERVSTLVMQLKTLLKLELDNYMLTSKSRDENIGMLYQRMEEAVFRFASRDTIMLQRQLMMKMEFLHLAPGPLGYEVIEYPRRPVHVWRRPMKVARPDESIANRKQLFIACLRNTPIVSDIDIAEQLAWVDLSHCLEKIITIVPPELRLRDRANTYLANDGDLFQFKNPHRELARTSSGLLILGGDLERTVKQRPWSHLSYLFARYIKSWEGAYRDQNQGRYAVVLRHFIGLRQVFTNDAPKRLYVGVQGLLLSLCEQMITNKSLNIHLQRAGQWSETDLRSMCDGNIEGLCTLFRDLLIEVSDDARLHGYPRTIVVAIDGIQWLETNESTSFNFVVSYLRALCDEMAGGDLGKSVILKYIMTHAGYSELLERPHPAEDIMLCPFDHTAELFENMKLGYKDRSKDLQAKDCKVYWRYGYGLNDHEGEDEAGQ